MAEEDMILEKIRVVLFRFPDGIDEFHLMQELGWEELRNKLVPGLFCSEDPDRILFCSHFLLFHLLYRLKERLRSTKSGSLTVFCLEIRLVPQLCRTTENQGALEKADPMEAYYLNLQNMETVSGSDVRNMLEDFFRRFASWENRDVDLKILGLDHGAGKQEIKEQYHRLVMKHHPDRGGNAQKFREVAEAMERLEVSSEL
ncbi:DNA-J related domain-containing protein [Sediminispirochaeta bajacaliforniensis]|uniref:DNA-J related domain-containing protein n=1 Tax=Sediminispirochaeta bajacaliforniensis TaxID=148 RepID=UPI000371954A|nr:DNA-J related domain-containing protein [Sediminispirochaeta bajacaliforniensis]